MPLSEWKEYNFSDLGEIKTGKTPPTKNGNVFGDFIQFVTPSDITNQKYIRQTARSLSREGFDKVSTCKLPKDSIIVTCIGSDMGKVVVSGNDCVTNQQINSIIVNKDKFSVDFIYYNFSLRKKEFFNLASGGSTMPILNKTSFSNLKIKLPPLPQQRDIAEILSPFDDKIELNNQMNKTLEEIAQTIFKSWFVDFEPVKAKEEGLHPANMNSEIADLFPDEVEESEIGLIPKGWKIESLGNVTTYFKRGISPKYVEQDGILVINQRCIRDMRLNLENSRRHDESKKNVEGRLLEIGDILINSTGVGTLGRVAQVEFLPERAVVDSHVTVVRADQNRVTKTYLGLELLRRQQEIESLGEGSTGQTELSRERLAALKLIIPELDNEIKLQKKFEDLIKPIREKMYENELQSQNLATIRDLLLPKLISGDLPVKDADKFIQGA